jgi:choline dehydrogenase-like flavoprotein
MLFSIGLPNDSTSQNHASVVVVGSGPAGAAATLLLARSGVDVTVLEAGLPGAALGLTARVGGITVARLHRPLTQRSDGVTIAGDPSTVLYEDIAPGGLTNHWSCAVPRFSPDDFLDARRAGEAHTWPLEYDELLRWYEWVEPLLCIAGSAVGAPQLPAGKVRHPNSLGDSWKPVAEAAQRAGQAILPVPYVYGDATTLTFSGNVFNAFVRLVKPLRRSGPVSIRYGARVVELEWSPASRRVAAVLIRDVRTGDQHRIPCRAVVLAAGAINTTKILLQSTSQEFPDGLGNSHGVLGCYLHDHPLAALEIDLASPLSFHPAAYVSRLPLERSVPLYAAASLQWAGVHRLVRSALKGSPGREPFVGFSVFGTMAPSVGNRVTLDRSRPGADGTPGLVLNIRYPPESVHALEASRDQSLSLLTDAGLQPRASLWVIAPVGTAIHYAGACRMHTSPEFGMLDRRGRMHAVPNVVVADSAAFTTGPEKNPVLTAMALAARASHELVDDLRSGAI